MRAVDTNVIIRYLMGDNPVQARKARTVIDGGEVFVGLPVLLEAEWVLRTIYGVTGTKLENALRGFIGLPSVSVETPEKVMRALAGLGAGMGFADALHLASAGECEEFLTFDRTLARLGEKLSGIKMRLL